VSILPDGGTQLKNCIEEKIRRKKVCEERMAEIREEYKKVGDVGPGNGRGKD